jgi:osmotically-inducible protein OsmY
MKKYASLIFGSLLLFGISACDVARTSYDAPDSTDDTAEDIGTTEETREDSDNNIRQSQLNADIRAREERNEWFGDEQERMNSDLESEVRAKLEANIPRGKLTVDAEDGKVLIVGTVPNEKEYETIEPLAKEIKGVEEVNLDVRVVE